jgi:uncharacterized Ntn-hydrolase superfamily protein
MLPLKPFVLASLVCLPGSFQDPQDPIIATFSIVALDPETGDLGVAVASRALAAGSIVPYAKPGVGAIATQASANSTYGPQGLELLEQGMSPQEVVETLTGADDRSASRQLGIIDAKGNAYTYTGERCSNWAGGIVGENYAVQGNILAGEEVVTAMAAAFENAEGDLGTRMLAALTAGQEAGGDRRGRQSAGVLVVREGARLNGRLKDYRVDDHPTPIQELKRIYDLSNRRGRRRPPVAGPVRFQAHDIAEIRGGYAVAVADFNNDGRLDVMANSLSVAEVAWHENPTWERHVIVSGMPGIVNQAMADLDADGIPEVAFQSAFAMQAANSEGLTWIARHRGDPRGEWGVDQIDKFATSHHVVWVDLDGDGELELVNAPLIGPASLAPTYDQDVASVFWYGQDDWQRHTIADDIPGLIHRVRRVRWGPGRRDQILVASFEGIALYSATGEGDAMTFHKELLSRGHDEAAPRLGASDVGTGMSNGRRIVASVEPWHGNEVVVYTESGGEWQRRVIFDEITRGHEIAVFDLNGDGRADIVANDNSRRSRNNPNANSGVHVFFSPANPATGQWTHSRIESEMAMNSCVIGDMNGDGRPDIICSGSGGMIRWYENLGS